MQLFNVYLLYKFCPIFSAIIMPTSIKIKVLFNYCNQLGTNMTLIMSKYYIKCYIKLISPGLFNVAFAVEQTTCLEIINH